MTFAQPEVAFSHHLRLHWVGPWRPARLSGSRTRGWRMCAADERRQARLSDTRDRLFFQLFAILSLLGVSCVFPCSTFVISVLLNFLVSLVLLSPVSSVVLVCLTVTSFFLPDFLHAYVNCAVLIFFVVFPSKTLKCHFSCVYTDGVASFCAPCSSISSVDVHLMHAFFSPLSFAFMPFVLLSFLPLSFVVSLSCLCFLRVPFFVHDGPLTCMSALRVVY